MCICQIGSLNDLGVTSMDETVLSILCLHAALMNNKNDVASIETCDLASKTRLEDSKLATSSM